MGCNPSANLKLGLDPGIQTCHGFRKYFENALDEAKVDHEKKMIIEGHFARTRAQHYTDSDIEGLREIYGSAYPFIRVGLSPHAFAGAEETRWQNRPVHVEAEMSKQRVLEARLIALENKLNVLEEIVRNPEAT